MVNWNTSLFYVRVCLPAPLERPDVCTMNAKICEDGDHLSKSEQIAVLFGLSCDVRSLAFLEMCNLTLSAGMDELSNQRARQEVLQVHELHSLVFAAAKHRHASCEVQCLAIEMWLLAIETLRLAIERFMGQLNDLQPETRSRFSFSDKEFLFIYDFSFFSLSFARSNTSTLRRACAKFLILKQQHRAVADKSGCES